MDNKETKEVRIDKWLWAVRIFKTRTIATDACKKNRVAINGSEAKPSKMVKIGDVVKVKRPPVTYEFEVMDVTEKRMGAKLVPDFMKNVTPPEAFEALELKKLVGFKDRAKGLGRPTKKDRRDLDNFAIEDDFDWEDFDWDTTDDEIN